MYKIFLILSFTTFIFISCNQNTSTNTTQNNVHANAIVANAQNGKILFNNVCSSCHGLQASDNKNNAPILENLKLNYTSTNALMQFIRNAPEALQATEHGKALFTLWKNNIQMPPYIGMSEQELTDLAEYLYTQ